MVNFEKIRPGYDLWLESVFHDSGEYSNAGGGKTTGYFSLPGQGKSTLLEIAAQISSCFPGKQNKDLFIRAMVGLQQNPLDKDCIDIIRSFRIEPETIVWRIRDGDGFANLVKPNWDRSFQGKQDFIRGKEFHVWIQENDAEKILFYVIDENQNVLPVNNLPKIEYYHDAMDLIQNLHWGAINAVLEPQTYKLSKEMVVRLKEKKMEINDEYENQLLNQIVDAEENGKEKKAGRKPGARAKTRKIKQMSKYDQMEVSPSYFWFEVFHAALKGNRKRHISVILDECDDVMQARSEGNAWKFIDILANDWKSLRKFNISAYLTTHQTDFVDWRILQRMEYKIWMRGAIVRDSWSMITQQELISGLDIGKYIIEFSKIKFGINTFPKIPRGQPNVNIDGLKGQRSSLTNAEIKKLIKAQENAPDPMEHMEIAEA